MGTCGASPCAKGRKIYGEPAQTKQRPLSPLRILPWAAPVENFTISFKHSAAGTTLNFDWETTCAAVLIVKS
jgi:hypothetical protein